MNATADENACTGATEETTDANTDAAADPSAQRTAAAGPPIGLYGASLVLLAILASLFALQWAMAVLVPLLLGLMLSAALTPAVKWLVRWHVPRSAAAALVLCSIVGGIGTLGYSLSDDVAAMIENLPEAAQKLRRGLERESSPGAKGVGGLAASPIETVQRAAAELERAAEVGASTSPPPTRGVTKVQIEKSRFNVKDYLWPGALGLAATAGQAAAIFFITFFLLSSGGHFRRKMVHIVGPTFRRRKITVQALDEITSQIQRYLLVQVFTSALVGLSTGLVFHWIGVDNAAGWGLASFVLNFIPYLGNVVVSGGSALLGFVQFGSFEMALLIGGAALFINAVESYIVTPWLTSKASRMNPVAVFVGVLAWGWLWGLAGLFLGMPILMAVKAVCDRVETLKPVGLLLGD